MAENVLSAETRSETGKGANRRLRVSGKIPAVIYGKSRDAQSVTLDPKALETLLHKSGAGLNTLIDLSVSGRTDTVLVKELQRHPVHGSYVHVDFFKVDLTQKITVSVPIHFVGKARGVEFGGILDHPLRELEVECLPRAIPEFVEVDVSALEVGAVDPRERPAAARGRRGEDGCDAARGVGRAPGRRGGGDAGRDRGRGRGRRGREAAAARRPRQAPRRARPEGGKGKESLGRAPVAS